MATEYTPFLNLAKPGVNDQATENAWGYLLNSNCDAIDAYAQIVQAYMNQPPPSGGNGGGGTTGLSIEDVDDRMAEVLRQGSNVNINYDDVAGTITISATPGATSLPDGDKGDIVVSGGGTIWMFDPAVVTAAGKALLDDTTTAAQRTTIGLGNVDNTADINKPISQPTQTALDAKANVADTSIVRGHRAFTAVAGVPNVVFKDLPAGTKELNIRIFSAKTSTDDTDIGVQMSSDNGTTWHLAADDYTYVMDGGAVNTSGTYRATWADGTGSEPSVYVVTQTEIIYDFVMGEIKVFLAPTRAFVLATMHWFAGDGTYNVAKSSGFCDYSINAVRVHPRAGTFTNISYSSIAILG